MTFDGSNKIFKVGDHTTAGNNTYMSLSDAGGGIELSTVGVGSLGDMRGYSLGTYLSIDDVNEVTRLQSEGNIFLGDDDWVGYGNGTHIQIDDDAQQISMSAASGVIISSLSTGGTIDVHASGTGHLIMGVSDVRLKKEINTISQSLDTIKELRGVTYKWKTEEEGNTRNADNTNDRTEYGFIAQEITGSQAHKVSFEDQEGFYGVNKTHIIPILVEAIKELEARVVGLEEELKNK